MTDASLDLNAVIKTQLTDTELTKHAKWIFSSATIVGTLGGAFQLLGDLTGPGRFILAIAVALTGISLALATFSLLPKIKEAKEDDSEKEDDAEKAYDAEALRKLWNWRRSLAQWAAICLGVAIFLASLAPLTSILSTSEPASVARITHTLARDTLRAHLEGSELPPYALASLMVMGTQGTVASARALADSTGTLDLELPVVRLNPENSPFVVLGTWADPQGERAGADTVDVSAVAGPP